MPQHATHPASAPSAGLEPEITAGQPHHHARIWHCPAHPARVRGQSRAEAAPHPGITAHRTVTLVLPNPALAGPMLGSHAALPWAGCVVPGDTDRPHRAPPHVPVAPWPNGCARADEVRGNVSPRRCAESGNSHRRSAIEEGAGWTGEPRLPTSPSPHLQTRAGAATGSLDHTRAAAGASVWVHRAGSPAKA